MEFVARNGMAVGVEGVAAHVVSDDDSLSGNRPDALVTERAVKTYVDNVFDTGSDGIRGMVGVMRDDILGQLSGMSASVSADVELMGSSATISVGAMRESILGQLKGMDDDIRAQLGKMAADLGM